MTKAASRVAILFRPLGLCSLVALVTVATGHVGKAEPACLSGVVVQGLVFKGAGRPGDFRWMAAQASYRDALFVFSDNVHQFEAFIPGSSKPGSAGCALGGGNAGIRPLQCSTPPRAAGIPTGPGFASLTPQNKVLIDKAIARIVGTVRSFGYRRIFYSATNAQGDLGSRIFEIGPDVKTYIVDQLVRLPKRPCL